MEMPQPKDIAAVQRLLGLSQYLSNPSQPLRHHKTFVRVYTERFGMDLGPCSTKCTGHTEESCVKYAHLRYYNLIEEITLQCDASQFGLGAVLMQNGQPVAYTSRALTVTETRYAQIEKELLAIVFACDILRHTF